MNLKPIAITVGAGAASLAATSTANRAVTRKVAEISDPSASVLPTLMFAGYGTIGGAVGLVGMQFGTRWAAPVAAAGAGALVGAFVGQKLGLDDFLGRS